MTFLYMPMMREVMIIRTTDSAAANGQLRPLVSCSCMIEPTRTTLLPPRISAIKKSPMDGTKVSTTPDNRPGRVSFSVTVRNAYIGEAPRSLAASTRDQSIFSALEYTDRIINGSRAYTMPTTTAG